MSDDIKSNILTRLHEIEDENNVEIVFAIESGSRAWGFESVDSDYDVRFIYRHDIDWYLSVFPQKDTIEYPVTPVYDYSGWDVKKVLYLLNKSNPIIFEWLESPLIYMMKKPFLTILTEMASRYFSPNSSMYHYLSMARNNYREYLKGDTVRTKKYLYALRPIFTCMWIEKHSTQPPIVFEDLLNSLNISPVLKQAIDDLIRQKKSSIEMGTGPKIPVINDFLSSQISYYQKFLETIKEDDKPKKTYLNKKFKELLQLPKDC